MVCNISLVAIGLLLLNLLSCEKGNEERMSDCSQNDEEAYHAIEILKSVRPVVYSEFTVNGEGEVHFYRGIGYQSSIEAVKNGYTDSLRKIALIDKTVNGFVVLSREWPEVSGEETSKSICMAVRNGKIQSTNSKLSTVSSDSFYNHAKRYMAHE